MIKQIKIPEADSHTCKQVLNVYICLCQLRLLYGKGGVSYIPYFTTHVQKIRK